MMITDAFQTIAIAALVGVVFFQLRINRENGKAITALHERLMRLEMQRR